VLGLPTIIKALKHLLIDTFHGSGVVLHRKQA